MPIPPSSSNGCIRHSSETVPKRFLTVLIRRTSVVSVCDEVLLTVRDRHYLV